MVHCLSLKMPNENKFVYLLKGPGARQIRQPIFLLRVFIGNLERKLHAQKFRPIASRAFAHVDFPSADNYYILSIKCRKQRNAWKQTFFGTNFCMVYFHTFNMFMFIFRMIVK